VIDKLAGRDPQSTVLADQDVRVGVPLFIGYEHLYARHLGNTRNDARRRLHTFGLGCLDHVGDPGFYGSLRDCGPYTSVIPTPFSETVRIGIINAGGSYPAVAQLVVSWRAVPCAFGPA
jgi:hypothetical protein